MARFRWWPTISTGVLVGLLVVGGALARYWAPPLLAFAGTHSDKIEALTDMVQNLIWACAGVAYLVKGFLNASGAPSTLQSSAPDPEKEIEQHYLRRLRHQCNILPLPALGSDDPLTGDEVSLEQVYVALDTETRVPLGKDEKERRGERLRPVANDRLLTALEAVRQNGRVVMLGDPGSGKSTFARQLCASLAAARLSDGDVPPGWESAPLPVFTVLRDLVRPLAEVRTEGLSDDERRAALVKCVWARWRADLRTLTSEGFADALDASLDAGNALLVFDGLDEVPIGNRGRAREAVCAVLSAYPRVRHVLVTCRVRSYADNGALPRFAVHTLAPFGERKIRDFATGWYRAQRALGHLGEERAKERGNDLAHAATSSELYELASNPMLLTTMAIIHQQDVGLPSERVRLYDLAVKVLLSRWQKHKGIPLSEQVQGLLKDDLKLRALMERIAYEAHCGRGKPDEAVELRRKDLLDLLEQNEQLGNIALSAEFLDYVDQRAGLLVGRGGGDRGEKPQTYTFPHRTFQEYLAGAHMAGLREVVRQYRERAELGETWQLAARLGAEELLFNRRTPNQVLDLAYALCPTALPQSVRDRRAALWSGHMAVLLGRDRIARDQGSPDGAQRYLDRLVPGWILN